MDDVVVTGVGVVSAAGSQFSDLVRVLGNGEGAIRPIDTPFPVTCGGAVPGPLPETPEFLDDRKAWLAFAAVDEALQDAGVVVDSLAIPSQKRAVFLGTGLSSVTPDELADDLYPHLKEGRFQRDGLAKSLAAEGSTPWRHLPDRVTGRVAELFGAQGSVATSFSACAASAQAIAEGIWALRRGEADMAIVGGHDSMLHPMGLLSFVVLGAVASTVCRPFDRNRDGFVLGEGAAIFVLERRKEAQLRGAKVRARLLGAGTSADGWNVTAPHPDGIGAERAMRRALKDARLDVGQVGYVNAHGTGTPVGDVAEAKAIRRVLGDRVPVSSIKGALGHTIAAAGGVELAACIAALEGGWLPGTMGLSEPDPACAVRLLKEGVFEGPVEHMISNSFGFGGQNCALVVGRA